MVRNFRLVALCFICTLLCVAGAREAQSQTLAYRHLQQLCDAGEYEEAIRFSTEILETQKDPVPLLFYWRAYAFYHIGWFEQAERDLLRSPNVGGNHSGLTPQKLMAEIQGMKACLPQDVEEIKIDGQVIFRVYHDSSDPLAKLIIKTLPKAYEINTKLLGTSRAEQPVFIFNDYAKHRAFERNSNTITTSWATANRQGIYFRTVETDGTPSQHAPKYVQGAVIHEYNHNLFRRIMGNVEIPHWFVEGFAEYAVELFDKDYAPKNDRQIAALVQKKALLPPQSIENIQAFQLLEEYRKQMIVQTNASPGYSAYTQGYHMTRYLIGEMPENGLVSFLNAVKQSRSFNSALQQCFAINLSQFYQFWSQAVQTPQE